MRMKSLTENPIPNHVTTSALRVMIQPARNTSSTRMTIASVSPRLRAFAWSSTGSFEARIEMTMTLSTPRTSSRTKRVAKTAARSGVRAKEKSTGKEYGRHGPRRRRAVRRRSDPGRRARPEGGHDLLGLVLRVTEEHRGVLEEEQRVLHARVAGGHRPLEHDDVPRAPHLGHGHARDGRGRVVERGGVDDVVRADHEHDVGAREVVVDLVHLEDDVVGHLGLG